MDEGAGESEGLGDTILKPTSPQWWILVIVALLAVFVWPPSGDRSLAVKLVNWAVDPEDALPVLPDRLALGLGDDPDAVNANDLRTQQYDALYLEGGWTRTRLQPKVARDPLNPSTERLLTGIAVLTAFPVWRFAGRTN